MTDPINGDQEVAIEDFPQSCDVDHDWVIDDFELLDFIDMWVVGGYCWDPVAGEYRPGKPDGRGDCQ